MKIEKVLNNNVAVTSDDKKREIVVMGRGLTFQAKVGDTIDEARIEKTFIITDESMISKFQKMMENIPMAHMLLAERIISYARVDFGKKLNDSIYVTLPDHISAAILRYHEGIVLQNPLLWDIRRFYKDEYEIGQKAKEVVQEELGVCFLDDEAAFIAMHFVNAQLGEKMDTVYDITYIMQEICAIMHTHFQMEFDEDSLEYYRFITHIKFFAQRVLSQSHYADDSQDILDMICYKYPDAYECTQNICRFMLQKYQYVCESDEMLYLTAHIARVSRKVTDAQ